MNVSEAVCWHEALNVFRLIVSSHTGAPASERSVMTHGPSVQSNTVSNAKETGSRLPSSTLVEGTTLAKLLCPQKNTQGTKSGDSNTVFDDVILSSPSNELSNLSLANLLESAKVKISAEGNLGPSDLT